jgi:hypothetical protein
MARPANWACGLMRSDRLSNDESDPRNSCRNRSRGPQRVAAGAVAGLEWHRVQRDFFYKVVNAQLTFEVGADGRATAVVLHQFGRDQRASRAN